MVALFDMAEIHVMKFSIFVKCCSPGVTLCPGFKRRDHNGEGIGEKLPKVQVEKTGCWLALQHLVTFGLMGK